MTDHTIGVDISKASLDVFDSKRQQVRRFDNTDAGFGELSKWLVSHSPARVVYEPTGPYHRNFEDHFSALLHVWMPPFMQAFFDVLSK